MSEFLRPCLDAHAATLNRWNAMDRVNTVGASDVGQCERKVWYSKHVGTEFEVLSDADHIDTYGAKLRGTMFEMHFWAPALKATFGDRLLFAGEEQQTFVSGYLSATPDGLLTQLAQHEKDDIAASIPVHFTGEPVPVVGDCVMVECKTFDPRTNLADPKTENVFQTQVQMGLVRERTKFKPTHSILSYTDASWWSEGREWVITFDQNIYDNAKARAERIMNAESADQMEAEGWIGGGRDCEYCPFTKACGVTRRRVPDGELLKTFSPEFIDEVTRLAHDIKRHDAIVDSDTEMLRTLQDRMKTTLRNHQARKVPGIVSWSSVKGKSGWDNKAIREAAIEAGVDVSAYATEGEPSDRLQITLKG